MYSGPEQYDVLWCLWDVLRYAQRVINLLDSVSEGLIVIVLVYIDASIVISRT